MTKTACFFSTESEEQIMRQQYSVQDIRILESLGYRVVICSRLKDIPFRCDLYFGWWAAGSILPLIVAKLSRRPLIVVCGGNETMYYEDSVTAEKAGYLVAPWYKKLAVKITLRFADSVLVVSKFMQNGIKSISNRATNVVHLSVCLVSFAPNTKAKEYITTMSAYAENLKLKRFPEFLRAAAIVTREFPLQKFLLIGTKPQYGSEIFNLINELNLSENLVFAGHVPNKKISDFFNLSHCFVQISDTETFGLAVAEAMSCNVPVIVSSRGALPEVAGHYGIYVDHNEPESIAAAMLQVLRASDAGSDLNSRTWVENKFSFEIRKNHIENIIRSVSRS